MGVFPLSPTDPPLTIPMNMISTNTSHDRWIIPHPEQLESYGTITPLSAIEKSYVEIVAAETPAASIQVNHQIWNSVSFHYLVGQRILLFHMNFLKTYYHQMRLSWKLWPSPNKLGKTCVLAHHLSQTRKVKKYNSKTTHKFYHAFVLYVA